MSRLRSLIRLRPSERRAVLTALVSVAGARLLLWVLPYRSVRALLESTIPRAPAPPAGERAQLADGIARDVARTARAVPGATCLVQALAAEWLIRRTGASAVVRFGVAREEQRIGAHAWVESGGRVVLGAEGADHFTPFIPFPAPPTGRPEPAPPAGTDKNSDAVSRRAPAEKPSFLAVDTP